MGYYTLDAIKKNIETPITETSLDDTLNDYGEEADAWVDSIMGNGTPLVTYPAILTHISSNYAAGRYLSARLKEDARGEKLMQVAEKQLRDHIKGPGHIVVFG